VLGSFVSLSNTEFAHKSSKLSRPDTFEHFEEVLRLMNELKVCRIVSWG
jgi:hypothetical protein